MRPGPSRSGSMVRSAAESIERGLMRTVAGLLEEAAARWVNDRCYRLGASLAYYAIFSIFPLLLLSITVLGYALGEGPTTRAALLDSVTGVGGSLAVRALLDETLVSMQEHRTARGVGAVVGLATLLFGASGVFSELSTSLNTIWRVEEPTDQSAWQSVVGFLRDKALSFAVVGLAGLLLVASLALSTALSTAGHAVRALLWAPIDWGASVLFLTIAIAGIFRALPRTRVTWRDVLGGALVAALLLAVLKWLMAWYLAHVGGYAAYGAVGAVLGLLLLIYVSGLIVFFGAELASVFSERFGSRRGAVARPAVHEPSSDACPQ
jgi:membrane protein